MAEGWGVVRKGDRRAHYYRDLAPICGARPGYAGLLYKDDVISEPDDCQACARKLRAAKGSSATRKARGRRTNSVVAAWLRAHGWPAAESTWGTEGGRDIRRVAGHCIEVKARADFQPAAWLKQARGYVLRDDERPCVILRLNGQGEDAGEYLVIRRLADDELSKGRRAR
jgi:hypothetical protein